QFHSARAAITWQRAARHPQSRSLAFLFPLVPRLRLGTRIKRLAFPRQWLIISGEILTPPQGLLMRHALARLAFPLLALLLQSTLCHADLKRLDIQRREPFAGGKAFGETGPYEKLVGVATFVIDTASIRNQPI